MTSSLRFLIISLGNPAPYYESFHSAGHHVLNALPPLIGPSQPRFSSQRIGGKATFASISSKYLMVQSPTLMNVSGQWVAAAWKELLRDVSDPKDLGLLIVHDDLEVPLGEVKQRKWSSSHRGHNGVKDIGKRLQHKEYQSSPWARFSVGIGRPNERDHGAVSDYVLRNMSRFQRETVQKAGTSGLVKCLQELEDQWTKKHG